MSNQRLQEWFCFVFFQSLLQSALSASLQLGKILKAIFSKAIKAWVSILTKIMWKMQLQKNIYHQSMEWISSNYSVLAAFKLFIHSFIQWNSVLHAGLQVDRKTWHIVLFADAEVVMDAELSLQAYEPCFDFSLNSYHIWVLSLTCTCTEHTTLENDFKQ